MISALLLLYRLMRHNGRDFVGFVRQSYYELILLLSRLSSIIVVQNEDNTQSEGASRVAYLIERARCDDGD
ncbi:MAG TPA: hypothetical protein DHW02_07655 [Ktedonobacter sp.]|nr:hypothetical protein [Ktedonobacter sp.]